MPELQQAHHVEYSIKREMNELFMSVSLKNIAIALVAIFEPIFYYNYFDQSVYQVLLFFGIIYFGFGLFVSFGAKLVSRIGVKHSILLSVPFVIMYYVGLNFLPDHNYILYFLPVFNIAYKIFFWPAYHLDFAKFSDKKKRGRQIGILKIINLSAGVISPFIGGFIILKLGFSSLFLVSIILLLLSVVPLFMSKEVFDKFNFNLSSLKNIFKKHHLRSHLSIIGWGVDASVGAVIWPLILFFIVKDYSTIGGIASVATFIIIFFVYYIGALTDKYGSKKIMRIGVVLTGIGWIFRGLVNNVIQAFVVNSYYKFSFQILSVGFNKEIYKRINLNQQRLEYIVYREILLNIGRIGVFVFAGLLFFVTGSFLPATIIASLGIFAMFLFY